MTNVGMDLGKKQSELCVLDERDGVTERGRVRTQREALTKRFANVPPCRIAIESCRDTGWVFDHLMSLGHEVVVVDTTRASSPRHWPGAAQDRPAGRRGAGARGGPRGRAPGARPQRRGAPAA
ncbi:MAG: hypothetical protein M0C28_07835 [Candidatus Moduliflexus flocculans]|nr:hypothetical protein [Candidatus Moduliflexus flocculans]